MYEAHFGLRRRPFPATPDLDSYYPATGHEEALAQLLQALGDCESFAVLTGEPGTGKTLLGQRLVQELSQNTIAAFLTHSHVSDPRALLQALAHDFGLLHEGKSEQELRLALTDFLLDNYSEGRRNLIIMDEAQNLQPVLLEELRLLSNLEGPSGRALQVVLVGQAPLRESLRGAEMRALQQRVGAAARLLPLEIHEAADYLAHHLRFAGRQPEAVVTDEAMEMLARKSCGIPRLLNRLGHAALRLAWQADLPQVDAEVALECVALCGWAAEDSSDSMATPTADSSGAISSESLAEHSPTPGAVLALEPTEVPGSPPGRRAGSRTRRLAPGPKRPA